MRGADRQLAIVAAVAVVLTAATILAHDGALAIPGGLALVLVLPGYGVVVAIAGGALSGIEQAAWTVGASLCIVIVTGFLLAVTVGIDRTTWLLTLGGITLGGLLFAAVRSRRGDRLPSTGTGRSMQSTWSQRAAALAAIVALLLGATAVAVARLSAEEVHPASFTELWLVPERGAPTGVEVLGVMNHETRTRVYRVRLEASEGRPTSWRMRLAPRAHWQRRVFAGTQQGLVATLTSIDGGTPIHRRVFLAPGATAPPGA